MQQVYIMCPNDGGTLRVDNTLSKDKMVCDRCGARYPFTPTMQRYDQEREIARRLSR